MYEHKDVLKVPVMVRVGATFDFLAGEKKEAALWMKENGLEWFYRLIKEPRRFWKRYLIGNAMFAWLIFKELITRKDIESGVER